MVTPKIYLAGPEVFFANPASEASKLKEICTENSLEGWFPTDADYPPEDQSPLMAERLYLGNVGLLDKCDAVIANMSPFRGVSMDVGTAFEIGYAIAQGKPVFGWSNEHDVSYHNRAKQQRIDDGMTVENYAITDNLMVVIPLKDRQVHPSFTAAAQAAGKILPGGKR